MSHVGIRLAIGLASVVMLAGCAGAEPAPPPAPVQSTEPTGDGILRVGTIFPRSGGFAFIGSAQVAGVELAVREVNDAGGVAGVPVEILHRDSGDASGSAAEEALADLAANKADVVIGPSSSAIAERLIPLAARDAIVLISPAATFTDLTDLADSGYFFRTIPSYDHQGVALGEVLSESGPARVAIVYVDDDLGRSVQVTLAESLSVKGSELAVAVPVPSTATDLASIMKQVVESKPDAVVLASTYSTVDLTKALITQLIASGYGGPKLWLTTQNTGDYSQAFPANTLKDVNGIIEGFQPDEAFIARLKEIDPTLSATRYAAEAYDATILAALAAVVGEDDGGASIAATLTAASTGGIKCTSFQECLDVLTTQDDFDYDGVSGPLNFDSNGDIAPAYYGLYKFNEENKFVFDRGIVAG